MCRKPHGTGLLSRLLIYKIIASFWKLKVRLSDLRVSRLVVPTDRPTVVEIDAVASIVAHVPEVDQARKRLRVEGA